MKTVLKDKEWNEYLNKNVSRDYLKAYACTHKYTQIFKAGDYYYCFNILRGYKNLTSLKKLL